MPYIFSQKQIDHAYNLFTQHKMSVQQVADEMGCGIRSAWHLLRLVKQNEEIKKEEKKELPKLKQKHGNTFFKPERLVIERPKAQYTNKRLYDLI